MIKQALSAVLGATGLIAFSWFSSYRNVQSINSHGHLISARDFQSAVDSAELQPVTFETGQTINSAKNVAKKRVGHPSFLSPQARPIAIEKDRVFVVNTPADTVDVIDKSSKKIVRRINVGIDPVSLAIRPDGKELWVSNHISDSLSVINLNAQEPTYLQVVATIQDLDSQSRATRFDEPVAIAFAGNRKAYVALSSENKIAVVDVEARKVTKRLAITAQDPRDIVVRGNRLYVIPFESNNQTQ